jgi:hypothetical protein
MTYGINTFCDAVTAQTKAIMTTERTIMGFIGFFLLFGLVVWVEVVVVVVVIVASSVATLAAAPGVDEDCKEVDIVLWLAVVFIGTTVVILSWLSQRFCSTIAKWQSSSFVRLEQVHGRMDSIDRSMDGRRVAARENENKVSTWNL